MGDHFSLAFHAEGCDEQLSTVDVRGECLAFRLCRRIGGGALTGGTMRTDREVSVDRARGILNDLVRRRELMERKAADASLLEANRLAIIYWQRQLSRLLAAERQCTPQAATATRE
ncbi:MAG: hypothetical protein ACXVHL_34305 [Solirubrobacteraceae bacterium]